MKTRSKHENWTGGHGPEQQFTGMCLWCFNNVYETDICCGPTVALEPAFKPGDRVITKSYGKKAVILRVSENYMNMYEVLWNHKDAWGDQTSTCCFEDVVGIDKDYREFESSYRVGDYVLAPNPDPEWRPYSDSYGDFKHQTKYGERCADELISWRLYIKGVDPETWLCTSHGTHRHGYGRDDFMISCKKKVFHESEFKGVGQAPEPYIGTNYSSNLVMVETV